MPEGMTFDDWLAIGIEVGWVTQIVCQTHDGTEMTPAEEQDWEDGYDPCIPVMRVWGEKLSD
jgi:hypothetical protein